MARTARARSFLRGPRAPAVAPALAAAIAALALVAAPGPASAAPSTEEAALVPRGSRADGDAFVSSAGFRDTVEHVARILDGKGVVARRIGPYRAHGVDVVRWLPDPPFPDAAIHVFRAQGKTWISFVKRSP